MLSRTEWTKHTRDDARMYLRQLSSMQDLPRNQIVICSEPILKEFPDHKELYHEHQKARYE